MVTPGRALRQTLWVCVLGVAASGLPASEWIRTEEVLTFDDLRPGHYAGSENASRLDARFQVASESGRVRVWVSGYNPDRPNKNAAVIFDSSRPHPSDPDLRSSELENILIVADNVVDRRSEEGRVSDGFVDRPYDTSNREARLDLEFPRAGRVAVTGLTMIDIEQAAEIVFLDGLRTVATWTLSPPIGDNEVVTVGEDGTRRSDRHPRVEGVTRMEIHLKGSGGVDDIRFVASSRSDGNGGGNGGGGGGENGGGENGGGGNGGQNGGGGNGGDGGGNGGGGNGGGNGGENGGGGNGGGNGGGGKEDDCGDPERLCAACPGWGAWGSLLALWLLSALSALLLASYFLRIRVRSITDLGRQEIEVKEDE